MSNDEISKSLCYFTHATSLKKTRDHSDFFIPIQFTNSIGARQHFHGCVFPDLLGIWLWICKCVGVPWVPYFYFDPNFFFSSNLTQHSISQTNFVVVRLRRKKNWLAIIQASFVITVLLYFFAYFFTLFVSSILLGRFTLEAEKATALLRGVVPIIDVTASIFKAMALRALELCCVQEVLLLIYAYVRNISFSFFMIFLMYLPLLSINGVWYPFGASSIQRFIVQDNAITWVAIYSSIYITGYFLLRQWGIKKIFN